MVFDRKYYTEQCVESLRNPANESGENSFESIESNERFARNHMMMITQYVFEGHTTWDELRLSGREEVIKLYLNVIAKKIGEIQQNPEAKKFETAYIKERLNVPCKIHISNDGTRFSGGWRKQEELKKLSKEQREEFRYIITEEDIKRVSAAT